jgi:hypothetical protein
MPVAKLSPQAFASTHRKMVEDVVAPAATRLKAKTLNDKLKSDLFANRNAPNANVALDNIKEIGDANWRRAMPLKELYDTSESMALDVAKAAAKASGGVLDKSSARFLPFEYQADFEKMTGVKIDDKPGAAVKGVKIKLTGNDAHIDINFKEALAGATANKVVLGLTQRAAIIAERVNPPENPNLPSYWVYISARPGKNESGAVLVRDSGISGFDSDSGSLIRAGDTKIDIAKGNSRNTVLSTLTFKVDEMNDLGSDQKPPSEKTKAVRTAWIKKFDPNEGYLDIKGLPKLTRAEFEAMPGAKTLLSSVRENFGSISKLIKDERIAFVRDPASKSAIAYVYADGEMESWAHVLDEKAKRWVGTLSIADDGTKGWEER